jgi:uncharacterized delta-60 repeat protein
MIAKLSQHKKIKNGARSISRLIVICLVASLLLAQPLRPVRAVDGELDLSFGTDGKTVASFAAQSIIEYHPEPHANSKPSAMALEADGKILLAGQNFFTKDLSRTDTDFSLMRYNSDGTHDGHFGNLGKITAGFSGGHDSATALAIQQDGKILVAGFMTAPSSTNPPNRDFGILRYLADGNADASFGQSGIVLTDFSGRTDSALAISVQPDGHFFVAGVSTSTDKKDALALARYNSDGSLDSDFGTQGKITSEFGGRISLIRFQPDGKFVVGGSTTNSDFTLARYQADGSLDKAFGVDGTITTAFSAAYAVVNDLIFTPQGQLIAVGTTGSDSWFFDSADIAIVRHNQDGSLDQSFGNQGKVISDIFGRYEHGNALAVQPDGYILLAGFANDYTPWHFNEGDFLLARYTPEGNLDKSFGKAGAIKTDFGVEDHAVLASLQKDGRILVAGYVSRTLLESRPSDFSIARYHAYTPPAPDYSLALPQSTLDVTRGQTIEVEIGIHRTGGFTKPVSVSAPDVSELKIKLNPQTITSSDASARFTMKIKKAPVGSQALIFTARDDAGRERQVTLNLNIRKN